MTNFKSLLLSASLSAIAIFSNPAIASMPDADVAALEKTLPTHFAGFNSTPLSAANAIREASKDQYLRSQKLEQAFAVLATQLAKKPEFATLHQELTGYLDTNPKLDMIRYIYFMFKLATVQRTGSDEETHFLRGAGFPYPYSLINRPELPGILSDYESLLLAGIKDEDDESDFEDEDEYSKTIVAQKFTSKKTDVSRDFVQKGPFASVVLPMPGEDNFGFFFMAWTFFQGVHPVALPLDNNCDELHGIKMSRFAKFCHDLAHDELDRIDENVEDFTTLVLNHHVELSKLMVGTLPISERKKFAIRNVLPVVANACMRIHNNYHQSLLDILNLSLKVLLTDRFEEFCAFSAASHLIAHEVQADVSRAYGTPDLTKLLRAEAALSDDEDAAEETEDKILQTQYRTGESALSNEQMFELVKVLGKEKLATNTFYHWFEERLPEAQIVDYRVSRNPFYIEVVIEMLDGVQHRYRESTNYSIQVNLKHDYTILKEAEGILAWNYQYALPTIPVGAAYEDDAAYGEAVKACGKQLSIGLKHLRDFWFKTAQMLSEMKPAEDVSSIAEKYAAAYDQALTDVAGYFYPEVTTESKAQVQMQIDSALKTKTEEDVPPAPVDVNNDNNIYHNGDKDNNDGNDDVTAE